MKVLIGHFTHEANTFCSKDASFEVFAENGYFKGNQLFERYIGTPHYIGGFIKAAEEEGIELIPTIDVGNAAATLERECVERIMGDILPVLESCKNDIDGICFGLHGAGYARGIEDLESYILHKFRDIVGDDMPIMSSLDLHGNISDEMLELSDGLFGVKQYPHVDSYETGYLTMKTLAKVLRGEPKPEMAVKHLPLMIPLIAGFTRNEPFISINEYFKEYILSHGLIDATLFHGFPYTDVSYASASVLVVGKGAKAAAEELARYVWTRREGFIPEVLSPAEALNRAEAYTGEGYVVINEASDNPGCGTPGDGTHLLREMLKRNLPGSIMGFIYDPEAAEEIHKHRVGERIDLVLGGKTEKIHGEPLHLKNALICNLSDGECIAVGPMRNGVHEPYNKTARIRVGNIDIIIAGVRMQTLDNRPFLITGADIEQYRYVGLKSTNHFRGFFQSRAGLIVPTDPPGVISGDLSVFDYKHTKMPKYPLDRNAALE